MDIYCYLEVRGYKPKIHKLDNETSKDIEAFIREQQATLQYTPPDMHHSNPAKKGNSNVEIVHEIHASIAVAEVSHWILVPANRSNRSKRQLGTPMQNEPTALSMGSNGRQISF